MPAPQPGTPTAVALTGVITGARFGIEWHSVLASTRAVKPRSGELPRVAPCRHPLRRLMFPTRMANAIARIGVFLAADFSFAKRAFRPSS